MATIRKRTWLSPKGEEKTAWIVDYRDGSGARRFKQFSRKRDADAWLTSAAWQVSQGTHTADSQSITVAQACEIWIAAAESKGRERGTLRQYRQLADLHIAPLIGAEKLSRLTQPKVAAFRDELIKTRSPAMAAKIVRALSSVLREAQRRGLTALNAAANVKVERSTRDKPKAEIPTAAELRAMLDHAPENFKPLLLTAILTGLRASELRGLRWADVDFKNATISVNQRADRYNDLGPPKSKAGYRTIPIPGALVAVLREWKLACPLSEHDLAFPNRKGGVQNYNDLLRDKFAPVQIAAGVADPVVENGEPKLDDNGNPVMVAKYGFHALRHACASGWIKQRVDLKRLTTWLGHSSVQLSIDVYGHLLADAEGDAALVNAAHASLLGGT
ncbi:site-specific integrase [Sphingopyxis sp. SCN 67-31]|uniref:tyrosine-type recombinase/integrase n=1 Tax=Sphingopyxis sp. SCN 67-31 TaxID=1660142 RepID=UPI00086C737C|nr:site-specific integrase [Sphingopyxis sp. SCN 67-31]ODU34456.1 MAG: integrase [Sphingopyxis sp. SCN 67-31]